MTDYNQYYDAYVDRGIWEAWHGATFDDYSDTALSEAIKKLVEEESRKNIILYGNTGTGKTMLMNVAMKELYHKGNEVYVLDFRHLVMAYTNSWRGDEKIARLLTVDYLAIDDLGKEFNNGGASMELARATLDYVLRYRIQRNKSTWITMNFFLGEVKEYYGEFISSLLKRSSVAIPFKGEDYGEKNFEILNLG